MCYTRHHSRLNAPSLPLPTTYLSTNELNTSTCTQRPVCSQPQYTSAQTVGTRPLRLPDTCPAGLPPALTLPLRLPNSSALRVLRDFCVLVLGADEDEGPVPVSGTREVAVQAAQARKESAHSRCWTAI